MLHVTDCHRKGITAASWVPGSEQLNNLNNFLLFINLKNLREGMSNEYVYTHMYLGAGGVQLNTGTTLYIFINS